MCYNIIILIFAAGVRYAELHKGVQAGSLHELLGSPIDALADMK